MDIDLNKCFICDDKTIFYLKNIVNVLSKHTETPIYKFIEKFMGDECHSLQIDENQIICQQCLIKIDEYDLASATALKVEQELVGLLITKHNKNRGHELLGCKSYIIKQEENHMGHLVTNNGSSEFLNERDIIMKCNICFLKFESVTEMSQHTHKNEIIDHDDMKNVELLDDGYVEYITGSSIDNEEDDLDANSYYALESDNKNDFSSKDNSNVRAQNENTHNPKVQYECEECGSVFKAKAEYRVHKKVHEELPKLVCYICGIMFKSQIALNSHILIHQGGSPHECIICGKKFSQKGALARHMPIHTGEKMYQCEICGKQFIHHSSFHMHKLAHDNIREKKCNICGLKLRSSSHLNRHLRVHTGEKPHTCPTCGQKFAQRYNMMTHAKIHEGVTRPKKSHACPICNLLFFAKKKLQEHLASVHNTSINSLNDNVLQLINDSPNSHNKIEVDILENEGAHSNITELDFLKKSQTCPICNRLVFCKKKLQEHLASVHNTSISSLNDDVLKFINDSPNSHNEIIIDKEI